MKQARQNGKVVNSGVEEAESRRKRQSKCVWRPYQSVKTRKNQREQGTLTEYARQRCPSTASSSVSCGKRYPPVLAGAQTAGASAMNVTPRRPMPIPSASRPLSRLLHTPDIFLPCAECVNPNERHQTLPGGSSVEIGGSRLRASTRLLLPDSERLYTCHLSPSPSLQKSGRPAVVEEVGERGRGAKG